jgi:hypothetical protein
MARIGKKTTPAKAKPAEKKRPPLPVKDCCGAQRGHKATCKMLLDEERGDTHGVEADLLDQETLNPSDVLDEVQTEGSVATTLVAALRGIEESVSRMAETLDTIKVQIGSYVNRTALQAPPVEAAPTAPKARKAKPAPEATPEPAAAPADAGSVDLGEDEPTPPPPPEKKAAPALTMDEVRTAFLGFASRKGRDAAVALLAKFKAAKLGEVEPSRYAEIMKHLKAEG